MAQLHSSIDFTKDAARKVYSLMAEEGNLELKLRVYVSGGGCSGFQYGFTFDEKIEDDDSRVQTLVSNEDESDFPVTLLIDAVSYPYLKGAMIDYKEDVQGAQFVIKNPNAKTTCGCGSSFAVAEEEDDAAVSEEEGDAAVSEEEGDAAVSEEEGDA